MFYLGGLTLGYLTPYPQEAESSVAGKMAKKKVDATSSSRSQEKTAASDEKPMLWPWHIFY